MTITKSGQVTVPKEVRDILRTNTVAFEVSENNEIHLIPIQSVEGSLNEFVKPDDRDFKSIRDESWKNQTARLERE